MKQQTPRAITKHIAIAGYTNAGKSSLINAICGHDVALVSGVEGTTTDPVYKNMEIRGVGAVTFIDTAGFADASFLGEKRLEKTKDALKKADIILFIIDPSSKERTMSLYRDLYEYETTIIPILNEFAVGKKPCSITAFTRGKELGFDLPFSSEIIRLNAQTRENIDELLEKIKNSFKEEKIYITRDLVRGGDFVLMVMPQDIQAPEGRLILPQVQTIRELLDRKCIVSCTTLDRLPAAIENAKKIDLVITDSQVFKGVDEILPKCVPLTSFSILFASYKGDIDEYVKGALKIDTLNENSKVLIAEACTHAPAEEDIGRIKIPNMLRKKYGNMQIDFVRGGDFIDSQSDYDLIIQCGACMFNRKYVLSRIKQCQKNGVAITNYGIAIAKLTGILDRVTI